jgi:hypothetical protein
MKMNLKVVKEVSAIDQFLAVMDLLKALGYETDKLTIMDVTYLKSDIIKAIEESDLDPYSELMNNKMVI